MQWQCARTWSFHQQALFLSQLFFFLSQALLLLHHGCFSLSISIRFVLFDLVLCLLNFLFHRCDLRFDSAELVGDIVRHSLLKGHTHTHRAIHTSDVNKSAGRRNQAVRCDVDGFGSDWLWSLVPAQTAAAKRGSKLVGLESSQREIGWMDWTTREEKRATAARLIRHNKGCAIKEWISCRVANVSLEPRCYATSNQITITNAIN